MSSHKEFDIEQYISENTGRQELPSRNELVSDENSREQFIHLCKEIKEKLGEADSAELHDEGALDRQRKALLGEVREVQYYKNKIGQLLMEGGKKKEWFPSWYSSIEDAIFNEILGFAGIDEWIQGKSDELRNSSSCKIIGERIYFEVNGKLNMQPQTISASRRALLRSTLLLSDQKKIRSEPYHEVYLQNGSRVTIYSDNGMTKQDQDCIVFRKYLSNLYTFEQQAERHTIPEDAIPLLKAMVKTGFNVAFTGPVKSAKTTFMTTWQSYEDPNLEGLMIETDPEIPLHGIMPMAAIMQLVPQDEYMDTVISTAKRSDAQYVILGEARDGRMLNIAVEAANMGTRRSKVTFHSSDMLDFCYDIADKITKVYSGDLMACMIKVAKSFHYVVNMISLPSDRSQKRMKGLWEVRYDNEAMSITMHQICKYQVLTDDWVWAYDIGKDKKEIGMEENWEAFQRFEFQLKQLADLCPNTEQHVFQPPYMQMLKERI